MYELEFYFQQHSTYLTSHGVHTEQIQEAEMGDCGELRDPCDQSPSLLLGTMTRGCLTMEPSRDSSFVYAGGCSYIYIYIVYICYI